MNHRTRFIEAA
jgi:hypothetical protein